MPGPEVEASFYPPSNVRRKSENIMPDFGTIFARIHQEGSKANLYFMWLRYKKEHPSGYQYTQFCHYFNQYVTAHHGSQSLRMAVERLPGERMYIDWVGGSATSQSFWWALKPVSCVRYISSSPPSVSVA